MPHGEFAPATTGGSPVSGSNSVVLSSSGPRDSSRSLSASGTGNACEFVQPPTGGQLRPYAPPSVYSGSVVTPSSARDGAYKPSPYGIVAPKPPTAPVGCSTCRFVVLTNMTCV